ncbi:MAG: bifunctional serine/threonine-protein kinase/formylglycine-generating enzyme family protein [Anaerolineae bacterium]|nr:bifunctional serine/threonine-protein kinase/formylglycine-generating enzyme family protein [Anaerolineae bacterium]NUQ04468.1 SUMF1/EgtB/PvdO family nonheme iron enzyme [Anaerolineae bacterium]
MTIKNDLTGQQIGQYRVVSLLGDGTSATVYRAQQITAFDRDVAIKVMRPELMGEPTFAERLETEARTIAALHHPNILRLIEYLSDDRLLCLVMDYAPGGNLADLMKRGLMPVADVERLIAQIAAALDYAHSQGVIHRDLKPQNVLLDTTGNALLGDFGIAKLISENTRMTRTGAIVGTPAYMSPEQWEGQPVDGRADLYAFGILVYEMLTGGLPFKADTTTSMMFQHLHTYPPPMESVRDGLPLAVDEVVKRAIAKHPQERFATTAEFATLLRRALHGRAVDLSPLSPLPMQDYLSPGRDPESSTLELPVVRQSQSLPAASLPAVSAHTPPRERRAGLSALPLAVFALLIIFGIGIFLIVSSQTSPATPTPTLLPATTGASLADDERLDARLVAQALVPAGCFVMGSDPARDPDAVEEEMPAHRVCVSAFWMDIYEVTHEAYAAFVDAGGYADAQWWSDEGWAWLQTNGFEGPEDRGGTADPRQPRLNLSWYEADAYARWRGGRLPTEAEWEYAARGEVGRLFAWGDGYQLGYSIINEISRGGTAPTAPNPVGSRPADHAWSGVYDMVGNACEWVGDWYALYTTNEQADPTGADEGTERVMRGGSFLSSPTTARLAVRTSRAPGMRARSCGLRVATPPG